VVPGFQVLYPLRPMISASAGRALSGPSFLALFAMLSATSVAAQDEAVPSTTDPTATDPAAMEHLAGPQSLALSLEDAVLLAIESNIEYQIAEVQTDIAEFDMLGSWGAFDWTFDASAGIIDSEFETGPNPQNPALPGGFVIDADLQPTVGMDFTKPLTSGGSFALNFDSVLGADARTTSRDDPTVSSLTEGVTTDTLRLSYVQPLRRGAWSGYATSTQREAEVNFRRQIEVRRAARQSLLFDVHHGYWNLVSAIAQRGVAQSSLDLGLEQLEQNRRRLEAGVGTAVDVLQAQATVASRTEAELQRDNDVQQAMDSLKALLFGGPEEELWNTRLDPTSTLPEGELSIEWLEDWATALGVALNERSDLRQQRLQVDAARLRHGRSVSERLAAVDLDLSISSRNVDTSDASALVDAASFEFSNFSATLNYNMPIGNRTANNAERAARADVRASLLTYDQLEIAALAEVRAAVRAVRFQVEAVRAAVQSLELARRQLEAEQARYEADLSTTFQVLEFQQSLVEALSSERLARAEFVKARVSLENARGTLDHGDSR
jgi:outer membrane protein